MLAAGLACGCGASSRGSQAAGGGSSSSVPAYVTAPPTHEQLLVEEGAPLIVADGCSACHLQSTGKGIAPSFEHFAGRRVELADGRRVLVDQRFLTEALLHPARFRLRGYDAAPMIAAVQRAGLATHPGRAEALAAFIEQLGPES